MFDCLIRSTGGNVRVHPSIQRHNVRFRLLGGIVCVLVGLTTAWPVQAASQPTIHRSRITGNARFLTIPGGARLQPRANTGTSAAVAALNQYAAEFGIADVNTQLRQIKQETDAIGFTHTSFQQQHKGVEVFSGILRVHQNAAGDLVSINGDFYPVPAKLGVTPAITDKEAVATAIHTLGLDRADTESTQLVIVDPGWYGDPPMGAHLAWYAVISDLSIPMREAFFIDADNGEVLDHWTLLESARVREIYDGNAGFSLPGTLARAEGDPAVASPEDVNRAYDYYEDVYNYYFNAFGRDSIDDNGLVMVATVNSMYPGCPNAQWNGAQMIFCDGAVTDDIVGHELTHGVTQYTANLIYQNQSGQLNESFSDVFGELIDLYNGGAEFAGPPTATSFSNHATGPGEDTPNNLRTASCSLPGDSYPDGVRWLMGEDATTFGGAIRDMWDPTCYGDPDFANSALETCDPLDSGGVHSGSGIPNHAFAMLTDGKTFNGYTINGIGPIKSGAVWYRALTHYLTPAADFDASYLAFLQAADDLVGTDPNDPRTGMPSGNVFTAADATEVQNALLAVEMNTDGSCGATDDVLSGIEPVRCADREMVFADDFESGAAGWTVFNSAPPTPYDWALTVDPLPGGHSGTAWFCPDADVGDCQTVDESGTHSLVSPAIAIPAGADHPRVSFLHLMGSEGGWDGGNVKINVNGGGFQVVPREAYTYNGPNAVLNDVIQGSTDPIGGEVGWTGEGGPWGRSVINLSSLVAAGDSVQFRFDFGKDGCTGGSGWYLDEFEVYNCVDCDTDSNADIDQLRYVYTSAAQGNIGTESEQVFVIPSPPTAAADVTMKVVSRGDFASTDEFVDVDLNGTAIATLFVSNASDCAGTPERTTVTIPAADFNMATAGGDATLTFTASAEVNPALNNGACRGESFIAFSIEYDLGGADCNGDFGLDTCQRANLTIADFVSALLAPETADCLYDFNDDGNIDGLDVQGFVAIRVAP